MASPRYDEAEQLVATIQAAVAALPSVTVTLDPGEVPSGSRSGVVLVTPPDLAFPTWDETESTWELVVVAGTLTNYLAAWKLIDSIIDAIETAQSVNLDSAEPGRFQPPNNAAALPAYTLTLNPS